MTVRKKKVYLRDNYVLEDFYAALKQDRLESLHVPHSDVFYVRAALRERTGILFPLRDVELAMKREGWNEGRILTTDSRYEQRVKDQDVQERP